MTNKLLTVGIIGTVTAGLCCLTPFLPLLLGAIGLSGALGYVYRDDVLLPLMAVFIMMTGYALWRRKQGK
jgi:mercuric ion transport protein